MSDKQTLSWMKQGIKHSEEKIKYFTKMTDTKKQVINQLNNLIDFTDKMGGLNIAMFKSHALLRYLKKYKIIHPMYDINKSHF